MNIALNGKNIEKEHAKDFQLLIDYLNLKGITYIIHNQLKKSIQLCGIVGIEDSSFFGSREQLSEKIDFLLSIGGDGTFLNSVQLIRSLEIPILGINTGRLGFLSNASTAEIQDVIDSLTNRRFSIEKRTLLTL